VCEPRFLLHLLVFRLVLVKIGIPHLLSILDVLHRADELLSLGTKNLGFPMLLVVVHANHARIRAAPTVRKLGVPGVQHTIQVEGSQRYHAASDEVVSADAVPVSHDDFEIGKQPTARDIEFKFLAVHWIQRLFDDLRSLFRLFSPKTRQTDHQIHCRPWNRGLHRYRGRSRVSLRVVCSSPSAEWTQRASMHNRGVWPRRCRVFGFASPWSASAGDAR